MIFILSYNFEAHAPTQDTRSTQEIRKDTLLEYEPPSRDVEILAKTLYGECRGVSSDKEKAAVVWVILNRLDAGFGDSIHEVVSAPYQFLGYDESHPVLDNLAYISKDVMKRYHKEKSGDSNVGRVIPADYLFFHGDGSNNHFRKEFSNYEYWDWSLDNPYKN